MFKLLLYFVIKLYHIFSRKHLLVITKRTFLIQVSSGIGDALMAIPFLRALNEAFPNAMIDVLCSGPTAEILESHPGIRKIFLLERGWQSIKLIRQLRYERYDAYIGLIPSNTILQILVPYFANIPLLIKHRSPHHGFRNYDFLFHQIADIPEGRHRIKCNGDLLSRLNVSTKFGNHFPEIYLQEQNTVSAEKKLSESNFNKSKATVGFHPGCNPSASFKRWPTERYAQLADWLQKEIGVQVIIVGGKDEMSDVQKIKSQMVSIPVVVAGKCTLKETAAVIKKCSFFVTNDSGIMHLATAVKVPTFAIFGPKDDRHIGPYGNNHTVIRNGNDVKNVTLEQVKQILLDSPYGIKGLTNSAN
ncbi:lipopolysaccharide heptosyltransferase II [bacterium]|nr:lipopolysaccharide heptosyltransferase II [bacterium]